MAVAIAIAGARLDCVGGSGRGCGGQSLWSELWAAVAWLCSRNGDGSWFFFSAAAVCVCF